MSKSSHIRNVCPHTKDKSCVFFIGSGYMKEEGEGGRTKRDREGKEGGGSG